MTLSRIVKFAEKNLEVAYRASGEPQTVRIRLELDGKSPTKGAGNGIDSLLHNISHGVAGGPGFPPSGCSARLLSGPRKKTDKGIEGPVLDWSFELAGVAPKYLRSVVQRLAASGGMVSTIKMSIQGSIPPDKSAATVTSAALKRWLQDPTAFVDAWPEPPFEIKETKVKKGATVRISLESTITATQRKELDALREAFDRELIIYRTSKDAMGNVWGDVKSSYSGTEMKFGYDKFEVAPAPPRNAIVNLLSRFSDRVAKVATLELAFAAG